MDHYCPRCQAPVKPPAKYCHECMARLGWITREDGSIVVQELTSRLPQPLPEHSPVSTQFPSHDSSPSDRQVCPTHHVQYQEMSGSKRFSFTSLASVQQAFQARQLDVRQREEILTAIRQNNIEDLSLVTFVELRCPICRRGTFDVQKRGTTGATSHASAFHPLASWKDLYGYLPLIYKRFPQLASFISLFITFNIFVNIVGQVSGGLANDALSILTPSGSYASMIVFGLTSGTFNLQALAALVIYGLASGLVVIPVVRSVKFLQAVEVIPLSPPTPLRVLGVVNWASQIMLGLVLALFLVAPVLVAMAPFGWSSVTLTSDPGAVSQLLGLVSAFVGVWLFVFAGLSISFLVLDLNLSPTQSLVYALRATAREWKLNVLVLVPPLFLASITSLALRGLEGQPAAKIVTVAFAQGLFLFYLATLLTAVALNYYERQRVRILDDSLFIS